MASRGIETGVEDDTGKGNLMSKVLAAGGVVWRGGELRPSLEGAPTQTPYEFLIVHRPKYNDWSLPKGKMEPGELLPACAVREIAEETGVQVCLGPQLGVTAYPVEGRQKQVTYWLAQVRHSAAILARPYVEPASTREINETRWVDQTRAQELLTQEYDRHLIAHAEECLRQGWGDSTPVMLVRHGKAKNRLKWNTDDSLRPLKKRGRHQAENLVSVLSAFGISRMFCSPWKRCEQTIRPYLKASGIRCEFPDVLSEDGFAANPYAGRELLRALLQAAPAEGPTALCSHAPVLISLMRSLGNDFLRETLIPLETGESLIVHVITGVEGDPKLIAVERAEAEPPAGYARD